jgi:hypothetical protein
MKLPLISAWISMTVTGLLLLAECSKEPPVRYRITIMRYALLFTVALALLSQRQAHAVQAPPAISHDVAAKKSTSEQYAMVTQQLSTFIARHDVAALSLAISAATAAPDDTSRPHKQPPFHDKLSLWLAIFAALDAEIDDGFDLANVPQLAVSPPPSSGLPAGADPASVDDPSMRKAYIESLAANELRNQQYQYQYALLQQQERAESEFEEFIARVYLPYPAQLAVLKNRIAQARLKPSRQAKLRRD